MSAPRPPQQLVIGGWKREIELVCDECHHQRQKFVVYAPERRSDDWCNAELDEMMRDEGWLPAGSGDLCPACAAGRVL